MSLTQKMFACSGFMLVVVLAVFARAIPVPVPEDAQQAEYGQFVPAPVMEFVDEPAVLSVQQDVQVDPAVVRPIRSASPFLGILSLSGHEKPYKTQQHHHHYHQEQHEYEPEYHHRPQYHKPQHEYEPEYHHRPQHHKPQHHYQQRPQQHGAGSYASAGSFAGGQGGGSGHSQSGANSQSASFGFGPFQASYSASSAQSGSHSGGGYSGY
ncbi:polyadenylate-binding protein 1-B-like [Myzus persicae]|uniref:polyadenylate-binding protein 1-B-like n=1 Tax=Myzus persicae TaxID=13164 RepID=UPI000B933719|nr:polyadenylate-binding protein 1-B-like [Myzus persicae]